MIEFIVRNTKAIGKARPRFNSYTHRTYTPKKTQDYEKVIKESYLENYGIKDCYLTELLSVSIIAHYKVPVSYSKNKKSEVLNLKGYNHKPDTDNIAKAILDGLNGIAYKDDSQIVKLKVLKVYDEKEDFIEIKINEYKGD